MPRLGIALGANIGDRLRTLQQARDALLSLAGPQRDFRQAPVFTSAPVDCPPGSPDFLNTVLELDMPELGLPEILAQCQHIEGALGRPDATRRPRNAPRLIDVDLLYASDTTWKSAELELPHPRMAERAFVLVPLACIAPERVPFGLDLSVAEMLAQLPTIEPPLRVLCEDW